MSSAQRALLWLLVAILMGSLAWALAHGLVEPEAPERPSEDVPVVEP